jgi:hypothetical protein
MECSLGRSCELQLLQIFLESRNVGLKMSKPDLAPPTAQRWTRIDDYAAGLARLRSARRAHRARARTQPETPSLLLSTVPFAVLIAVMAMLVVVFAVAAWPGRPVPQAVEKAQPRELGTAPKGWFDEAKKEFR